MVSRFRASQFGDPRRLVLTASLLTTAALFASLLGGADRAQAAFPGTNGKIAFHSHQRGDLGDEIYTMNANGTDRTRLTKSSGHDGLPAFSPDGTKIAFQSTRDGNYEIYVMNADGSGQTRLTNEPDASHNVPSFSPDGTKIAFSRREGASVEIYVMNADGTGQTRLTNEGNRHYSYDPSFSSDGRIVFVSERDGPSGEIYVMNADGTAQTRLTNNGADDSDPSFSPDGTRITFDSDRDATPRGEIYMMNADGTGQTRITKNSRFNHSPVFSPDGTKIAFNSWGDDYNEIYVMNADGTGQTRLKGSTDADEWWPDWGVKSRFAGPVVTPDYKRTQKLRRKLKLKASCDEPCAVVARGKLKTAIKKGGKLVRANYTVRQDGTKLDSADERAELTLVLTKKARKKARKALAQGGKAKVTGVVKATDDTFNVTKQRFEIGFG